MEIIGTSAIRKEGRDKISGRRPYIDDLTFDKQIFGATIRSPCASGILKRICFSTDINWDEFTIVTADDIPGENYVALIMNDQPLLAKHKIAHKEEAIVLIAHPNKEKLLAAKDKISFEIETLPSIHSIEESLQNSTEPSTNTPPPIWGDDNVFKELLIHKNTAARATAGIKPINSNDASDLHEDVEATSIDSVWKNADFIIEGSYETGAQEQMYIETNGIIADYSETAGITVWGSMQCPYYVHTALVKIIGLPKSKVRVIQTETGGAFGGKEEYPSMIAGHAAMLAYKAKCPVRLIYGRKEDLTATTKRHPSKSFHRTAVSKDGQIQAMEIDFKIDGGAYCTVTPVVLSRGALHAAGPYRCDHIKITAKAVATNTPPYGAFRGFGAPQSTFAMERHIEKIARTIGMDAQEFRLKNLVRTGDTTSTGQVISDDIDMQSMLRDVLTKTNFREKRTDFKSQNQSSHIKKGIGLATFYHGAGFTGAGEKYLASNVGIEVTPHGGITILVSSTEMGQGTNTVLCQIAAEALNVDYDSVQIAQPDTNSVPDSGPTVASRTVMVVGRILQRACNNLIKVVKGAGFVEDGYSSLQFITGCQNYLTENKTLKVDADYEHPHEINWNETTYKGDAYATFAWAVYVAEVSVDTLTFQTTVDKITAFQEVGKVVNPLLATGQIEGGVTQGCGFAISEKVILDQGLMTNCQMTNYIIPTAADVADIEVVFLEHPSKYGPKGAKGIGELPMDGTPPAVINAVENALDDYMECNTGIGIGSKITKIPMLPEDLHAIISNGTAPHQQMTP